MVLSYNDIQPMEKNAVVEFSRRWQRLTELERALPPLTSEDKLRQLEGLLEIAHKAQWPVGRPEAEVGEVRRRWQRLRARLHGGPAR
jgi:hypothetical protein